MSVLHPHEPPASGIAGLKQSWRNDLLAALSVSMVALPLSLGIAAAGNVPPIAGLFSALVAGFVTTFVRGSHIAINGPGNGQIAVLLVAMISLNDGTGQTFRYVLAAIVVSGVLQILLGLLRLGKLGDFFPSSVLHGILAAIGVIIMGKQLHVSLGGSTNAKSTLGVLMDLPKSVMAINPYVALIAGLGLLILVVYPRIHNKLIQYIPAPMWVLLVTIPLAAVLQFSTAHTYSFLGASHTIDPKSLLVQIPDNLFRSYMLPNFDRIGDLSFWSVVFSITMIATIETIISAKAVDKLDPYKRETDPNKELIGTGIGTTLAGLIGGIPVVTVIARSSVNIHNSAKTSWSNFFTGAFLFVFVVVFSPIIKMVPMAALAAILVHTGYKLTSLKVFKDAHKKGWEQLLFLQVTFVATLLTDLVWGLVLGTGFVLLFHIIRLGLAPHEFAQLFWETSFKVRSGTELTNQEILLIDGIANFGNIMRLKPILEGLPPQRRVQIDFGKTELVDLTVLELISDFGEKYQHHGGHLSIKGLEHHQVSSSYPQALHVKGLPRAIEVQAMPLSRRQKELKQMAEERGWSYRHEIDWDASYLKNFQFFETRPIEYKENVLSGVYADCGFSWEIADLTFDEGAVLVDEHHTTVQILYMPWKLPEFVIERAELFDRLLEFVGYEDIDFKYFTTFSRRFVVKGFGKSELEEFFTPKFVKFFDSQDIYHLESNGEALLIFRKFRLERPKGIEKMHSFCRDLLDVLRQSSAVADQMPEELLEGYSPQANPPTLEPMPAADVEAAPEAVIEAETGATRPGDKADDSEADEAKEEPAKAEDEETP